MLTSLGKKIGQQLVFIGVILLILFAAYLSLGRQLIPAIGGYKSQIEAILFEAIGVPVAIESLSGRFEGFNPVIDINALRIAVPVDEDDPLSIGSEPEVALAFDRATLILDVGRSLLQRHWVLENFQVERIDASAIQEPDGEWRLRGINPQGPGLLLDDVYSMLLRVSRLELRNVTVNMLDRRGNGTRLHNGLAIIQNRGNNHFFHIDVNMGANPTPLQFSMEVAGSDLARINGSLHMDLPRSDYSNVVAGQNFEGMSLSSLVGGGQAWIELSSGQLSRVVLQPVIDTVAIAQEQQPAVTVTNLAGQADLHRDITNGSWELALNGLSFTWRDRIWPNGDISLAWDADIGLNLRARLLDLEMSSGLITALGVGGDGLLEALNDLQARGALSNVQMTYPPAGQPALPFELTANLQNVALSSYRNAPNLQGVYGYLALDFDFQQQQLHGHAEVDSDRLAINIPTVFVDTWHYDSVNGAVDFKIDTGAVKRVHIVSGIVAASSDLVHGRVKFSSDAVTLPDGSKDSVFTLLVGAQDVDGGRANAYLPSAPNQSQSLLSTMSWLEGALIDAEVSQAGVIYRGTVMPNHPRAEKTFQSFYDFGAGHLRYQTQWPDITGARGRVLVNDNDVDIRLDAGDSAGLALGPTSGFVREREDGQRWLSVTGLASGETAQAIAFLAAAPLNQGLDQVMGDWQAEGQVQADIALQIPLNNTQEQTRVQVAATVSGNTLAIPSQLLRFDRLSGQVNYSTAAGLHDSSLEAEFFSAPARINLLSRTDDNGSQTHTVSVAGVTDSRELAAWQRQVKIVKDVLDLSRGDIDYRATLQLPANGRNGLLTIDSELQGLAIDLPQPLAKTATERRPLHVELGVGNGPQELNFNIAADLTARMQLEDGRVREGVAYIGTLPGSADPWRPRGDKPGLEIRGNLDQFVVSEWLGLLNHYAGQGSPAATLKDTVSLVQVDVGNLDLFGQLLPSIKVEIQHLPETAYWTVGLDSKSVAGSVLIPFASDAYIEAYLAYLHLPGNPESEAPVDPQATPAAAVVEVDAVPRPDPLASMDPRRFPRLRFHTGDFSIGSRDYGLGQFTLDPTANGAEFSDLIVNFRGLQVGIDGEAPPRFRWEYDGDVHHSYLTGLITAGNLADVLRANGFAASLESSNARFDAKLDWPGSPAYFTTAGLSGDVVLRVEDGRFLQRSGGSGALKLISILNFDAIMRRLRFSDDLLRRGLAYDEISGHLSLVNGIVSIDDRLIISGPSSIYQISGKLDLVQQTIDGEMYLTLPVSDNIPWLGLLTANLPLAIGAYLFERIFGDQVDNLTSAQYTLQGPWDSLEPQFKQAFGTRDNPIPPPAQ